MTGGAAALRVPRVLLATAATISGWLLAATAVDLVVTRTASRMLIFVPKDPALAGPAAVVGRLAAFADTLVLLTAVALLVALIGAAASIPLASRLALAATCGVALAGLLAIVAPPSPWVGLGTDVLIIGALACFAGPLVVARRLVGPLRMTVLALAAAAGLAALARLVEDAGALAQGLPLPALESGLRAGGESLFLLGAAAAGWAGLRSLPRAVVARRRWVWLGSSVGLLVLLAAALAPATTAMFLTWSLGLSGSLPAPVYAAAAGLALAGLPLLADRHRQAVIGVGIVLLAGNALAASGLLLAGLLGLAVAARGARDG